jgi:hypothetical protein
LKEKQSIVSKMNPGKLIAKGEGKTRGLELIVEPAFDFLPTGNLGEHGIPELKRAPVGKGTDISLYKDGRLCLSPQERFNGRIVGEDIFLDFAVEEVARIMIQTYFRIKRPLRQSHLLTTHHAEYPDIRNGEPIRRNYLKINSVAPFPNVDGIIFYGNQKTEQILANYWARQFPPGMLAESYHGNNFWTYQVGWEESKEFWKPDQKIRLLCHDREAERRAEDLATLKIGNLSYGFRMRVYKAPNDLNIRGILKG